MEEGPAVSAAFQSLLERSITAWHLVNYVGEDKFDAFSKHIDILRSLSSMEALIEGRQFWFFQLRESFMRQDRFMKWDPKRLEEYILLPIDYGFANNQDCFFVSHYWRTREHPDPQADDLRAFREDLQGMEWSYIWLDWTCMPQVPRSDVQQRYFNKMLRCIPMVVRDCAFAWRFPKFEPRAWILFEVAEYVLNHSDVTITNDIEPFVSHVLEMIKEGVSPVINKYEYQCTSKGDSKLVSGWLEILTILAKVVPNVGTRQEIFDWINRPYVGSYYNPELEIRIDKAKGVIISNGTTYEFTPVFLLTADV
jgi:hypothetical protein